MNSALLSAAASLDLDPALFEPYGHDTAKVPLSLVTGLPVRGKLILVTAITPTLAGEGKTTVSIGLAQGLKANGRRVALALRQPSLGPVFGRKGGATGGGQSSLVPSDRINLHFTGDFHAITTAHNLLSAAMDNQLFHRRTRLDPARVTWKRVMDMNDRALRSVTVARGKNLAGRDSGFDITAASEIMAILCLAESMDDLRGRLDRIVLGFTADGEAVRASEMKITGALLATLRETLKPNFVRSVEGVPAFVHGGPFANIAHGCNSILATRMALAHADYAVTEAGFAFDLGGEKFLDIKCRQAGFSPAAAVLVATVKALKLHGGQPAGELATPDPAAVARGLENLDAHLDAIAGFGLPAVVALNQFHTDTAEEMAVVQAHCAARGAACEVADIFARGGAGGRALADAVCEAADRERPGFAPLYPLDVPVKEKLERIATAVYGADGVDFTPEAEARLSGFSGTGADQLPVCVAKTQMSLSDDAKLAGRPRGFRITVRDFELAAGAGFLVALTGKLLRMPALPEVPAAEEIDVNAAGEITGMKG